MPMVGQGRRLGKISFPASWSKSHGRAPVRRLTGAAFPGRVGRTAHVFGAAWPGGARAGPFHASLLFIPQKWQEAIHVVGRKYLK